MKQENKKVGSAWIIETAGGKKYLSTSFELDGRVDGIKYLSTAIELDETANGKKYLSISIELEGKKLQFVAAKNTFKEDGDTRPDYHIFQTIIY